MNHTASQNTVLYSSVFVNQDARSSNPTGESGVGYYTPVFFGLHNPTTSGVLAKVWTPEQGTGGTAGTGGANLYILPGETVYTKIAKVQVGTSGETLTVMGAQRSPNI